MKKITLTIAALALCIACNKPKPEPIPEAPIGTDYVAYDPSLAVFDGVYATDSDDDVEDKTDTDIYWEGEADGGVFSNTVIITFNGAAVSTEFQGKAAKNINVLGVGTHVVIETIKKCEIILRGHSNDGSVKIYANDPADPEDGRKKVKLTLDGLKLKSSQGPAINYQVGKRMYLHLADGTENVLEDAAEYLDDTYYPDGVTAADEDRKGAFFSERDVVLSGKGSLFVAGNHKHAFAVDNEFYMRPGPTLVLAGEAGDAFSNDDEVTITGGVLFASTKVPGEKAFKTAGPFTLSKGIVNLRSFGEGDGSEGLSVESTVTVEDGILRVLAYDSAITAGEKITINGGAVFACATPREVKESEQVAGACALEINGGDVLGIGGSAYAPTAESTQCCVVCNECPVSTVLKFSLEEANSGKGNISFTSLQGSPKAGVIISNPELKQGTEYSIVLGATEREKFTLDKTVKVIGEQPKGLFTGAFGR